MTSRQPRVQSGLVGAPLAAIAIGVLDVVHVRQQRAEAGVLPGLAAGEAHGSRGAAVKRAAKGDDRGPPRSVAGELDGTLDGLGAGVGEEHALLARARRDARQPLAQLHHALVVEIRAADVKEAVGRVLDRGDDLGMPVAGGRDRDAGHEVEEPVAVHVLHHDALPTRDDQRILLDVAGGGPPLVPLDDRARLGPRRGTTILG